MATDFHFKNFCLSLLVSCYYCKDCSPVSTTFQIISTHRQTKLKIERTHSWDLASDFHFYFGISLASYCKEDRPLISTKFGVYTFWNSAYEKRVKFSLYISFSRFISFFSYCISIRRVNTHHFDGHLDTDHKHPCILEYIKTPSKHVGRRRPKILL